MKRRLTCAICGAGELLEHIEEARESVKGDAAVGILFPDERVAG